MGPETVEHPEQIAAIYNELYPDLRAHAMKLVRSPERADDAIQAAFVNTIDTLKRGREIEQGDRWLHRCVRNACLHELRMERTVSDEQLGEMAASDDLVESTHWQSRCEEMYRAVGELPENLRTALLLAEVRGFTYVEVAAQMRRSVDSVRALIFRARSELRDALDARGEGLFAPLAGALAAGRAVKNLWRRVHDALCAKLGEAHAPPAGFIARALRPVCEPALTCGALVLLAVGVAGPGPAHSPSIGSVAGPVQPTRVRISAGARSSLGAPPGRTGGSAEDGPKTDRVSAAPSVSSDVHPPEPHQAGSPKRPTSTVARHDSSAPVPPDAGAKEPGTPPIAAPTPGDPPGGVDQHADPAATDPDGSRGGSRAGPNGEVSAAGYGANGEHAPVPCDPNDVGGDGSDGCAAAQVAQALRGANARGRAQALPLDVPIRRAP